MKAKLILLILLLFLTSTRFFGQSINRLKAIKNETPESSVKNRTADTFASADYTCDFFKSAGEIKEELRLELSCDVNSYSDEALLIFNNSDPTDGAPKLYSMYATAPELWSVKNGSNYSINFLGELYSANVVALTVKAGAAGKFTLTASQVESFAGNSEISLEDRESGALINLALTSAYTFQVSEPQTISNRFYLHFLNVTSGKNPEITRQFRLCSVDGGIQITSLQPQSSKISVSDMRGRIVATGSIEAGATTRIDLHGNTGIYIVSMNTGKGKSNTKILVN